MSESQAQYPYRLTSPYWLKGTVTKGFDRGSKELGIPTANLDQKSVQSIQSSLNNGIYYGYARIHHEENIWPMVMSIGWNPFYKNDQRSAEVHIIHSFENDFYDQILTVGIIGYIRPEKDYNNKNELIDDIKSDIAYSLKQSENPQNKPYRTKEIFDKIAS